MFEYHGWITVFPADDDDPDSQELDRREALARLKADQAVLGFRDQIENLEIVSSYGEVPIITMHGCLKRYDPAVVNFFHWAADNLGASYGLLYYLNDEAEGGDCFRIVRLAKGECTERLDTVLSPIDEVTDSRWGD